LKPDLRNNRDFIAGLLFAVIGALAVALAHDYPIGTTMRMGPGYFPTALGAILFLFGVYVLARGTAVGACFGVLPGTGPALSSFATYMLEKKLARDPLRFGRGAIEGVAAPEAANNAAAQTAFIPMLTLGIPASATMALMLAALTLQGIAIGPLLEENLRRALLLSRGDPTVFFTRPLSLTFMIATALIFIVMVVPAARRTRPGT
jgi:TctA family transporter